ncbi:MAG: hypothetical protein K0R68_1345 [Mycobacterium sp.]|jgi:hypothetical protein|nr:hypothetical protein [Mycobacterium sp.]
MDSSNLFSHPHLPEAVADASGASDAPIQAPVFSDLPNQGSHTERPRS